MNRADVVKGVLIWEQVAAAAKEKAGAFREMLNADARAEFEEHGTAPTWRLPDIGAVTLPVSVETPYVSDMGALMKWAVDRYPAEIETIRQLRPEFISGLASRVLIDDGQVIDTTLGEVVPGFSVRPGGEPKSLSIRPTPAAKHVIRQVADGVIAKVEADFNGGADS